MNIILKMSLWKLIGTHRNILKFRYRCFYDSNNAMHKMTRENDLWFDFLRQFRHILQLSKTQASEGPKSPLKWKMSVGFVKCFMRQDISDRKCLEKFALEKLHFWSFVAIFWDREHCEFWHFGNFFGQLKFILVKKSLQI